MTQGYNKNPDDQTQTKPDLLETLTDENICQENSDSVIISIEVSAGKKKEIFPDGYNPWRKAFGITVKELPIEGKANKAIIKLISKYFSIPSNSVTIISGQTSSVKKVRICGITRQQVIELINYS